MALEYGKKTRDRTPAWALPQPGEVAIVHPVEKKKAFEARADGWPAAVRKVLAAHLNNGETLILPGDAGAYPAGIVVAVRDRHGLIGFEEDGTGRRLEGSLSEFKRKKPGPKPKAAAGQGSE